MCSSPSPTRRRRRPSTTSGWRARSPRSSATRSSAGAWTWPRSSRRTPTAPASRRSSTRVCAGSTACAPWSATGWRRRSRHGCSSGSRRAPASAAGSIWCSTASPTCEPLIARLSELDGVRVLGSSYLTSASRRRSSASWWPRSHACRACGGSTSTSRKPPLQPRPPAGRRRAGAVDGSGRGGGRVRQRHRQRARGLQRPDRVARQHGRRHEGGPDRSRDSRGRHRGGDRRGVRRREQGHRARRQARDRGVREPRRRPAVPDELGRAVRRARWRRARTS